LSGEVTAGKMVEACIRHGGDEEHLQHCQ